MYFNIDLFFIHKNGDRNNSFLIKLKIDGEILTNVSQKGYINHKSSQVPLNKKGAEYCFSIKQKRADWHFFNIETDNFDFCRDKPKIPPPPKKKKKSTQHTHKDNPCFSISLLLSFMFGPVETV
jgi:hypothetical protein